MVMVKKNRFGGEFWSEKATVLQSEVSSEPRRTSMMELKAITYLCKNSVMFGRVLDIPLTMTVSRYRGSIFNKAKIPFIRQYN